MLKLSRDVDGSTIQVFHCNEKEIVVYDDYDVGAVFVLSNVDLSQLLSGRKPEAAA